MQSINPQIFTGQGATQGGGADPEGCRWTQLALVAVTLIHCYNPFNAIAIAL